MLQFALHGSDAQFIWERHTNMKSQTLVSFMVLGLCLTYALAGSGSQVDNSPDGAAENGSEHSAHFQPDEVADRTTEPKPAWVDDDAARTAPDEKHPIPFPKGFDYPASSLALEKMIKERDFVGVRKHGWYLWAGLNQPGRNGWPIWRSWYIATQVFASLPNGLHPEEGDEIIPPAKGLSLQGHNANNSSPPISYPIPFYTIPQVVRDKYKAQLKDVALAANVADGDNFQNNGDLMLVSEAYTTQAYQFIRDQKLYQSATLNALMHAGSNDIPQLPRLAMVLKHMYWPVKQDGLTALPVWDDPPSIDSYTGFEIQSQWPRAVAIDPSRATIPPRETVDVTFLYGVRQPNGVTPLGPNTYENAQVVSINDFYHKEITQADYDALTVNDRILLDLSFYWAHNRPFKIGDYVVAIASHVITKEIPYWTLQSAWWSDKPDDGRHSTDRPDIPQAQGPWEHYLLTTAYGITVKPTGDALPVSFNPYIELASHPIRTNCRNCHIRAAWPNGSYLALPVPPNPDTTANIPYGSNIFKDLLRSDFLWTIPDRAN